MRSLEVAQQFKGISALTPKLGPFPKLNMEATKSELQEDLMVPFYRPRAGGCKREGELPTVTLKKQSAMLSEVRSAPTALPL